MKKEDNKIEVTVQIEQKTKTVKVTYEDLFLTDKDMEKRGDKSIYLRAEYHERLTRIARVIGGDHFPLYAYLDNILTHHFDVYEAVILHEFENKSKPLF